MGALRSHVLMLIFHFPLALHQPSPCCCVKVGEDAKGVRQSKANTVICKNPHIANPDLSHFLPCLPLSLSLLRRPPPSPSPSIFLALPSQLSLIACEVINGFHLTSSPTLRRAPTNKTGAQNTNCPSEEP